MRCAGNMHSSYYKWNMAIICNPPIMLCATFVPCLICHVLIEISKGMTNAIDISILSVGIYIIIDYQHNWCYCGHYGVLLSIS